MYAVIDTEGSGLFLYKDKDGNPVPADAPGQPRLASLAIIFVDKDLNVEREYHAYVRPEGWEMSPGATAVNNLTTEFLLANGVDVREVLAVLRSAIVTDQRTIVAHHAQHDLKQVRAEFRRAGQDDLFEQTPNICTMRGLVKAGVKGGGRGGWPKLSEACVHFGIKLEGAHSALNDARATLQLFRKMRELGAVPEAKVHFSKVSPVKEPAA